MTNIKHSCTGLVYTYLAGHIGHRKNLEGAFRALKRGYIHWASGRVVKIEINAINPDYCHVRSTMKPSMKQGSYLVYILLQKPASIVRATCECAAG